MWDGKRDDACREVVSKRDTDSSRVKVTDRVRMLNTKSLCLICRSEITALCTCSFEQNPRKIFGPIHLCILRITGKFSLLYMAEYT